MKSLTNALLRLFVVIAALFSAYAAAGQDITQNPSVQTALSSMFEHVTMNTTRIPTGYLLDRAFEVIDVRSFSGDSLTSHNYADVGVFRNCLLTINSSRVNINGAAIDGNAAVNAMMDSTSVLLSAAAFQYNYIVANALTDQLITLINGKLYDKRKNGVLQNPFSSSYMFVMSPGVISHAGNSVHYKFSTSRLYGNCSVQSIQFDAGDGNGYTTLANNTYDNTVTYSSTGTKELKMKVTLTGGKELLGHALIKIEPYPSSPSGVATPADNETIISLPSNTNIKAKISYKCAPSHNGKLVKPFIFVEGFDFFGRDFEWFYDTALMYNENNIKNVYDVVYVDWSDPGADIADNALLLEIAISLINTEKHNNSSQEKNVIVGHSMGGLIARYALRSLELSHTSHETKCYVSYDSPHLGANVPLGLQYTVRDAHDLLSGSAGVGLVKLIAYNLLDDLLDIYESPSARQMMYYYVDSSGNLVTDYHAEWQETLDEMGFPVGDPGTPIENLAIVNGAPLGSLNSHLAHFGFYYTEFDYYLLFDVLPFLKIGNVNALFNIERNVGNGSVVSSAQATYNKLHLFGATESYPLLGNGGRTHYAPAGSIGYDVIPSSYLSTSDYSSLNNVDLGVLTTHFRDTVAFVPTASALATSDYNRNFYNNPPTPLVETPFGAYYLLSQPETHSKIFADYWNWISKHDEMSIIGPNKLAINASSYDLTYNGTSLSPVTWTTSNADVAYFIGNTLYVSGQGPVSIAASKNEGGKCYRKQLDLYAGIPNIVLSNSYKGNNTYELTVQCADTTLRSTFQRYVENGTFSYVWGYKVGSNSIVWLSPSTSATYQYQVSGNDAVSIYCKLKTCNNTYGNWVNILIQKENHEYFCYDPQAVYVDDIRYIFDCQTISFIPDSDAHSGGYNVSFLVLWRNSSYPNSLTPEKIIIDDNEEILLNTTYSYTLSGQPITLYRFNIMQSSTIQSTVQTIRNNSTPPFIYYGAMHEIEVVSGGNVVQSFILPIINQAAL